MSTTTGNVCIVNTAVGGAVVPVATTDNNSAATNINTAEAEVMVSDASILVEELAPVTSNALIEADTVTTDAAEVTVEASNAAVPLLEDNDLGLDVADGFGDDFLREFLEDNQSLLNDVDVVGAADEVTLANDDLLGVTPVKVVNTVEAVEVVQGGETSPVVEAGMATDIDVSASSKLGSRLSTERASNGTNGQKGCSDEGFGEHV